MKKEIPERVIEEFVVEVMKKDPARFIKYALLAIGRELYSTNADEFTFSQVSDLASDRLFKIEVVGKISEVV